MRIISYASANQNNPDLLFLLSEKAKCEILRLDRYTSSYYRAIRKDEDKAKGYLFFCPSNGFFWKQNKLTRYLPPKRRKCLANFSIYTNIKGNIDFQLGG